MWKRYAVGFVIGFLLGPCCKSRTITSPTVIKTFAGADEVALSDAQIRREVEAELAKKGKMSSGPGWSYK